MQARATARFTLVGSFVYSTIFTESNVNKYCVIESAVAAAPFHQVSNIKSGQLKMRQRMMAAARVINCGGGLLVTAYLI